LEEGGDGTAKTPEEEEKIEPLIRAIEMTAGIVELKERYNPQ